MDKNKVRFINVSSEAKAGNLAGHIVHGKALLCAFLVVAFASFLSVSCDSLDIDRQLHIGYVLLDDHTCVDTAVYENVYKNMGRKVVGVVFAEQTDEHEALAVMLEGTSGVYCDSVMSNGTSGDITKYDGEANTNSMASATDNNDGSHCPLASHLLTFHANGQSDYLPSVAEMRLLSASARTINPVLERYGGDRVSLDGDTWYWTSTEVSGNATYQAWLCSAVNGGIIATPKLEKHQARGIVALDYPE